MRDFELLCEIEDLQNRVSCLETEKMDIMLENGKNKKKLYAKKDKIKKQNIKLKNLQSQLDQQKARIEELESQFAYECECNKQFVQLQNMWNELKEWLDNNINLMSDSANYRQKEQLKFVIQKMQELEGEDE